MTRAWDLAHAAARGAGMELRPLTDVDSAGSINEVIAVTWGGQHLDREVVRALAYSGNVPWGAFTEGRLIGYVLGWAGVDTDGLHVHSHMLATLPDRRHRGVGYALKLAQRAQALDQGIHVARWTFDPLVARNAHFNMNKLGALVDRFGRNFYGEMTDDINRGERTDRFTVRWHLGPEPGPWQGAETGEAVPFVRRTDEDEPEVVDAPSPDARTALVEIPREYHELRVADPALGRRWREATGAAFETCLTRGMLGVTFDRERSAYLFTSRPIGRERVEEGMG